MEVSRHHSRSRKRSPQLVQSWKQEENQFFFYCPETILLVTICDAHILRFRFCPEGWFEDDFSYALPEEKVEVPDHLNFELQEVDGQYHLITSKLTCKITKSLHISIFNANGVLISEDERGFHWERHPTLGGNIVYSSKKIQEQENFYGLGDKPERFNLRGLRFENWGSDTYGFEKTSDPLYKNIPFFMGLHHGLGYGIFFDNSFRTRFDFGHERSDVCSFWSKGGEMNYYFIYGPNLINVVEGYAQITGKPEMPPMWALGYHQSKWSYYPEETVKSIGKELREYQIPCDALHIDIDYMDGFRCFTWDHTRFPDPRRMIAEMENEGFKTVVILDPGIKIDREYFAYKEGIENGYFCRRADGPLMQGNVWPGMCHFPDFTSPEVREWWAGLFEEFMKSGVHGVWNDMNEPALIDDGTFPQDTRHAYDGHYCSHRKAHNVYGMQMSRATYHGLKKNSFPRRPFALTRSTYAGGQRYAAVWTGDNLASWEHLWIANIQCQRLSISGFSFVGSDIGGFIGECKGELYTRWMQMAAFHPFFRTHSSGDHGDQEPWSFGEPYTSAVRKAIALRYQLMPYVYSVFWRQVQEGTPMILPLCFIDQHDPETYYRMEEFGLGNHMVICPISREGADGRYVYLPEGQWFNYWTKEKSEGRQELWVDTTIDTFPFFIKAGTVLPQYPVQQYIGEKELEILDLHIYAIEGQLSSELYEDDGDYYDYAQGNYSTRVFSLLGTEGVLEIEQRRKGRFNSPYNQFRLVFHGLEFVPGAVKVDDEIFPADELLRGEDETLVMEVDKNFERLRILRLDKANS